MFQQWQKRVSLAYTAFAPARRYMLWSEHAPFLLFALKSALAAAISWEVASTLLGDEAASLAPVSALIVVQVTSWQTATKSFERILGVFIGLALSILTIHLLGVSFWTILLMILTAQLIGMFVQKRGPYLATQIPISAVLGLVVGTSSQSYPQLRLLGALIGGFTGILVSLCISPPIYVSRAREATAQLASRMAALMPQLADSIEGRNSEKERQNTYTQIFTLESKVRSTEQALSLGFDSTRLNPWAARARNQIADYPDLLFALNRIIRQMRRTAFTLTEPEISWTASIDQQEWPGQYGQILRSIGSIIDLTARYMSALQRSKRRNKGGVLEATYDKYNLLQALHQTRQQFQQCSQQLIYQGLPLQDKSESDEQSDINAGNQLALQGAVLTDMRRMLKELEQIVTLLP